MCRADSILKSLRPIAQQILTAGPINLAAKLELTWALSDLETAPSMVCRCLPVSRLSACKSFACKSLETALWVGRKHGWNGSWAGRGVQVLRRFCWQFDLFGFLLRLLQEFDDFTPQGLFHRLVHVLEGLVFFLDAFFDGICICLDWSFSLCQVKSFLWNCWGCSWTRVDKGSLAYYSIL